MIFLLTGLGDLDLFFNDSLKKFLKYRHSSLYCAMPVYFICRITEILQFIFCTLYNAHKMNSSVFISLLDAFTFTNSLPLTTEV